MISLTLWMCTLFWKKKKGRVLTFKDGERVSEIREKGVSKGRKRLKDFERRRTRAASRAAADASGEDARCSAAQSCAIASTLRGAIAATCAPKSRLSLEADFFSSFSHQRETPKGSLLHHGKDRSIHRRTLARLFFLKETQRAGLSLSFFFFSSSRERERERRKRGLYIERERERERDFVILFDFVSKACASSFTSVERERETLTSVE